MVVGLRAKNRAWLHMLLSALLTVGLMQYMTSFAHGNNSPEGLSHRNLEWYSHGEEKTFHVHFGDLQVHEAAGDCGSTESDHVEGSLAHSHVVPPLADGNSLRSMRAGLRQRLVILNEGIAAFAQNPPLRPPRAIL